MKGKNRGRRPFGSVYAHYYDKLYADKDYSEEAEFVDKIFSRYSETRPVAILDAGSGTGGHALWLARKGYAVTGIDASKYMIDIAKGKVPHKQSKIDFQIADIRHFDLR